MVRGRSETTFKLLLLCLLMTAVACMPKVEEESVVPTVKLTSHATNGSSPTAMKITLVGTCPSSTYLLKVLVNGKEYSVGQSNVLAAANSGVPIGSCTKGILTLIYPVPNPTVARAITFKVKARLSDGRSSLDWASRTVNYVPPSVGTPGFAIVSVGGVSTGTGLTMHASGGESYGGVGNDPDAPANVLTSTQAMLRSGLHGVMLDQ